MRHSFCQERDMHSLRASSILLFGMVFGGVAVGAAACDDTGGQNLPECDSHQWSDLALPGSLGPAGAGGTGGMGGAGGAGGGSAQVTGFCLSRTPSIDQTGRVACVVLEMQKAEVCTCDSAKGRTDVPIEHAPLIAQVQETPEGQSAGWDCFCEIAQLIGNDNGCLNDMSNMPVDTSGNPLYGFCYVDATLSPPMGDPDLTESCAGTERRLLRFVGADLPAAGASLYAVCADEQCD
jgi:hypothetical protein